MEFSGKILIIGCGFVSRCTLPLILKHIQIPANHITVLDMADHSYAIKEALEQGVNYRVAKIVQENMQATLAEFVSKGDFVVDLACNIDCTEILQWCHDHEVLYLNTSVQLWDPYATAENDPLTAKTLYARHMKIRAMMAQWPNKRGTTAVLDHGANPGLASHFTKVGLKDIAKKIIAEKPDDERIPLLKQALTEKNFAKLAQLAGVKVIHISERDSQITNQPKKVNEFVNTWSIQGLYEEGTAPVEMGWGTHEKQLPENTHQHQIGPKNQICLAQMGIKTWVRSWVPCGEITGLVIRHGESFSISERLTVWEQDKPVYRPTVHYAYCLCDSAINSLHELEMRQFNLQPTQRIMTDEIIEGRNEFGAFLMGHDFKAWWVGSILAIDEARKQVPHQNASTVQVACSVVAAIIWAMKNPNQGVCLPDDLPDDEVLEFAKPYLGQFISQPVDWTPLQNRVDFYERYRDSKPTLEDDWQFNSFLLS